MSNKVLENLHPTDVFSYFEEICNIPHGSGNTTKIHEYLVKFAIEHLLVFEEDEVGNVIIHKSASSGYENQPGYILQGHMDMVAVKDPDVEKDLAIDGLSLCVDGDRLFAKGTSLGGDDGIAVAYMLAILADDTLSHPSLSCVFTEDEETGMDGARALSFDTIPERKLINLDSEDEGILLCGCAGGAVVDLRLPLVYKEAEGRKYCLSISGLQGGHSGAEIEKERGNAILLLARALKMISGKTPIQIITMSGGDKGNVIPSLAKALFISNTEERRLQQIVAEIHAVYRTELIGKDDCISLELNQISESASEQVLTDESREKLLSFITVLPKGVQGMSATMPGLVETSLNLGVFRLGAQEAKLEFLCRSSIDSKKQELLAIMESLAKIYGAACEISGNYPGWQYQENSELRELFCEEYKKMTGKDMAVIAIHAGVECGFFLGKVPDLDAVSIGPDMKDIHSTKETLYISSVARTYDFLLNVLAHRD